MKKRKKIIFLILVVLLLIGCTNKMVLNESELDENIWGYEFPQHLRLSSEGTFGKVNMTELENEILFTVGVSEGTVIARMFKDENKAELYNTDPTAFCLPESYRECSSFGSNLKGEAVTYPIYYNNKLYYENVKTNPKTSEMEFHVYEMDLDTTNQKSLFLMSSGSDHNPVFVLHQGYFYYPDENKLMIRNVEDLSYEIYYEFPDKNFINGLFVDGDSIFARVSGYKNYPESLIKLNNNEITEEYLGYAYFRADNNSGIIFDVKNESILFKDDSDSKLITDYPNGLVFKEGNNWIVDEIFKEDAKTYVVSETGDIIKTINHVENQGPGMGIIDSYFYSTIREDNHIKIIRYNLETDVFETVFEFGE